MLPRLTVLDLVGWVNMLHCPYLALSGNIVYICVLKGASSKTNKLILTLLMIAYTEQDSSVSRLSASLPVCV